MLTRLYIKALLVDEELADQVWETWDKGEIDDINAILAWLAVASVCVLLMTAFHAEISVSTNL